MVRRGLTKYERLGSRYGRLVAVGVLVVLAASAGLAGVLLGSGYPLSRDTVVIVDDPVVVWSRDRLSGRMLRITLPSDTVIDAVHGYGAYSLSSLWQLGTMERRGGTILSESLSEALGVPVTWYLGPRGEGVRNLTSSVVPAAFRGPGLWEYARGAFRTNMPIPTFLSLWWASVRYRLADVDELDVGEGRGLVTQTLADGSPSLRLDPGAWDTMLASAWEDERVRTERITVALYNTTDTPTLANRAARVLGHLGVFVVRVGNSTPTTDRCELMAGKSSLASFTSRVVSYVLDCVPKEGTPIAADLEVTLGRAYEARFLP